MSDPIRMEIDSSALASVNSLFLGLSDGARKTLVTTMNEVVKAGKKIVVDEINSVVTLKKDPLNKEIRYTLADAGQAAINALITASGKRQRLINYSCQQNQAGVSVQIYRDKPRSVITGSFMSTMKSGHKEMGRSASEISIANRRTLQFQRRGLVRRCADHADDPVPARAVIGTAAE